MNQTLDSQKVQNRHYEAGDASVVADKVGNAFTFVEQVFVFIVSTAVSLTLSVVAVTIGVLALRGSKNIPAIIGIVLGIISILLAFR